jgi:two-component system sensor histidine kinase QseC
MMNSLKRRLFLVLVTATGLIWLAATAWIYVGTTREVESVLDARLQEAARMVLSLASSNGIGGLQKADAGHVPEFLTYERQLSCQIWSLDGRLVARSSGAPDERLSDTRTGFSERTISGETWRVYTVEDSVKGVRVLVGDRLGLREHFVRDILKGLLGPMILVIPVLGLLILASLHRGLRPLHVLAEDLRRRGAEDMKPVGTDRIPSEIQPVVESLNSLFGQVSEALRHERELTALASHELRTPLAGLRAQAQVALATPDPAKRDAALRQIIVAVDRTTRLVRQLLAIAKLDSEGKKTDARSVNIGDLVHEIVDALPASNRSPNVIVDPALKGTHIWADRDALSLALRNLHENAVRHMDMQGNILWSMERSESTLSVYIEDEGPGIPDDELPLVKNRFFRGRNKSSLGSGLGLSIVDIAVRVNGARLVLQNRIDTNGLRATVVWKLDAEKPSDHLPSPERKRSTLGERVVYSSAE